MDIDVEYMLNKVPSPATVGNGSDQLFTNKDSNIGNFTTELEAEVNFNASEVSESEHEFQRQLEVNSVIFKDIFMKSAEAKKPSDYHNAFLISSGFEDLVAIKASIPNKETSDEFPKIMTSTPKKMEDANRETSSPRKKHSDGDADNASDDSLAIERNNDYLDTTIEEAINRYEKTEEKFKDISVQTNADELFTRCNNCLQNVQMKKVPLVDTTPFKKIKSDNNLIRPPKNGRKIIDVIDYKTKTDGPQDYWLNEAEEKIIDQLPISVSTVISVGRETFGLSKPPRIRVGLSKRVKPRKYK